MKAKLRMIKKDFNPRSPRGLRQDSLPVDLGDSDISIHAAQEGCDAERRNKRNDRQISIHAAQEGCDDAVMRRSKEETQISIHAAQEGCDH